MGFLDVNGESIGTKRVREKVRGGVGRGKVKTSLCSLERGKGFLLQE